MKVPQPKEEVGVKGNSPKSALNEFLQNNDNFIIDNFYHEKAWITSAPGGIIKRIK